MSPDGIFCGECGLRMAPPPVAPEPIETRRPRSRPWAAFALVIGLTAVGAGVGIAMLTRISADPEVALTNVPTEQPSSSASPTAGAGTATPVPTPVATSASTAEPTPTPIPANPILVNRAIADVRVDQLNVRASAGPSGDVLGQLRAGARVFVIGQPQAVDDMQWYRIAVVSGAYNASDCQYEDCIAGIGHVATPIHGDPWLAAVDIGCPASPMHVEDLARLLPLERLHCYGNDDIVVTGTIDTPCCGWIGPVRHEPEWLAMPGGGAYFRDVPTSIVFRADPATGLDPPSRGDVIRATGHLDDPASPTCRQSLDPAYADDQVSRELIAPAAEAVLICRTQLVISDYEVIDHEDLGPCCGTRDEDRVTG